MNEAVEIEVFASLPACSLILDAQHPGFIILQATNAYLRMAGKNREILGRPFFEIFETSVDSRDSGLKKLKASFDQVLFTGQSHKTEAQPYTGNVDGGPVETIYREHLNVPVLGREGQVKYIIHTAVDVTRQIILSERLKQKDENTQQQITDAISTTQELERMEISRDLHDNINQLLITSKLYLGRALGQSPLSLNFAEAAYDLLEKAIGEIKNISSALLTTSAEEQNLVLALERLVGQVASHGAVSVQKEIELPDESLIGAKAKLTVFRIVQEQFTNIIKHADATNVYIGMKFIDHRLCLTIRDDGKGFQMNETRPGLGFQNMKSRVAMMDGSITIDSAPGDGCTIVVHIPARK